MNSKHNSVKVNVSFRHMEPSDAILKYAEDKITNSVEKFIHHDADVTLVLTVEKNRHIAEAKFHCDNADFVGKEESTDMYASIDGLTSSLSQQLRRHRDRLKKRN